ncbi:unnamed protein product [Rotaria sp. Silwood2]|nr:unnamed protein product [Rotaria sp. Silwood2]CAF2563040.1 unnamed protein product [Rotaria sp. Silwood2]CAF2753107.1 unnamed protein product [Rotaria sp. Silwood2]CAF2967950.1 unnamed protein product [Rotaria sp. Silwood2]CAF3858356.1 unnamed protein product [Rotaria sp. Silwood2]
MTTTLDMNTPEETTKDTYINENTQNYIDKLHAQLVQDQNRRKHGRDYARILREYNKPPHLYKASPVTQSIYFYDPHYQRYLQQQSKSSYHIPSITSPRRTLNRSASPPTKHNINLHNPSKIHQQNSKLPSRLQSVPTLPPISTYKKSNDK